MAGFYEILGKDHVVLEASDVYATQFDAQMAGYQRMKEEPRLFGPMPTTGGKVEDGLRSVTVLARHGQQIDEET